MLLDGWRRCCAEQPQLLALTEDELALSYQATQQAVDRLAMALQQLGVRHGQRVALYLPRGVQATLAAFAVLKLGAVYVPLDIKNPAARLKFIVDDVAASCVIGLGEPPAWLEKSLWFDSSHPLPESAFGWVETSVVDSDLAAILYTSGSTGQPRGVALTHAAIAAFADWAAELVQLNPRDHIASSAPLFFDLSTFDLFAVLSRGASLHFMPQALTMAPARLSAWLAQQGITGWYSVPSLLAFLAYKGNLSQTPLPTLRFVLFAGEVFATPALRQLAHQLPQTDFYNLFGPTETNVCCFWPVVRAVLAQDEPIPIGRAAAGCDLRVAEQDELWVRGPTLASGYWRNGGIAPLVNADGWYATGDRVRTVDGEFHFLGRIGRMLKCSGYRVEPAEIERVIARVDGVRACAAVGVTDAASGQRVAVALVLSEAGALSAVRQHLSRELPSYMQPSRYRIFEQLPLLANGKLDYQQLTHLMESSE